MVKCIICTLPPAPVTPLYWFCPPRLLPFSSPFVCHYVTYMVIILFLYGSMLLFKGQYTLNHCRTNTAVVKDICKRGTVNR